MALVPFTHANPFTDQLRLPERLFTINGQLINIKQAWKAGGKGGTEIGFGASVYPAAYVLAEFLERHPHLVRGKRVIELGTGTGFLGIAAAALGATEVCLTDGDNDSLRLAESNIAANLPTVQGNADKSPASIYTQRLIWGCAQDIDTADRARRGGQSWDIIIGSDIAALPYASAYEDLLNTIVSLAARSRCGGKGKKQTVDDHNGKLDQTAPEPRVNASGGKRSVIGKGSRSGVEEDRTEVLILLAHKRRHDSEEVFFEAASQALRSGRVLGEEDIHPDFRDAGIRLHMFYVDQKVPG